MKTLSEVSRKAHSNVLRLAPGTAPIHGPPLRCSATSGCQDFHPGTRSTDSRGTKALSGWAEGKDAARSDDQEHAEFSAIRRVCMERADETGARCFLFFSRNCSLTRRQARGKFGDNRGFALFAPTRDRISTDTRERIGEFRLLRILEFGRSRVRRLGI